MQIYLRHNILFYIFSQFLLHLKLSIFNIGLTSWEFVADHSHTSPNPIGVGFQQLLCMIIHLLSTLLKRYKNTPVSHARLINFFSVLIIIILYGILGNWIWNWLWSLR